MIAKIKQSEKQRTIKPWLKETGFFLLGCLLGVAVLTGSIWWLTRDAVVPGVKIANLKVGGSTRAEVIQQLQELESKTRIELSYNGSQWTVPPNSYALNLGQTADTAVMVARVWDIKIIPQLMRGEINIPIVVEIDEERYGSWSAELAQIIEIVPHPATIEVNKGEVVLQNGEDGLEVDQEALRAEIVKQLRVMGEEVIEVPTKQRRVALNREEIEMVTRAANSLKEKSIEIMIDEVKVDLGGEELISFLSLTPGSAGQVEWTTIGEYVRGLQERFAREPQDAKFEFAQGRVQEFAPGRDGIQVVESGTTERIAEKIQEMLLNQEEGGQIKAEVSRTAPKISTAEVNNLGINERIGRGESYYAHSIANRIYNVGLAAERVNGALVAPGEEFSFNKFVGEISGATGYKTAYVISGGRTVLGDGGGVCQVSTTLFRAVMDAGLPITERWPHAYRVSYYEQNSDPGLDATVYAPSKDFKFLNDTPNYILVQAINDPKNVHLTFEIYGTNDGRVASVSKPKVWGVTPPPPDLYEDDPNLPVGTVRQVDWSAWGAKTSFDYKVTRDGETIFEKTYNSTYRAWQNVFIRGTGGI